MEENKTPVPEVSTLAPANSYAVPFAIVVAGLAIASAIYFGDNKKGTAAVAAQEQQNVVIAPVDSDDHILGNPKAKVVIVEYSDTECPFCKMFHETMNKVMNEYGEGGKVAWVYRHYPLPFHTKAPKEAEALECANKLGGTAKFWEYTNTLFSVTPANNGLEESELPKIAKEVGLDEGAFNACLASGEMKARVDRDLASGQKAGVRGTPHSIILVDKKIAGTIDGAQSYDDVKAAIENALR